MAFHCVIVTPEQQVLDESVRQAILPAHDGQIGILTGRAPLLVKLGTGPLEVDLPQGKRRTFFIDGGIAQMKGEKLTVLANEATPSEDIDAATARAELAEATAYVPQDALAAKQRQHRLERARVKEQIAARARA